MDEEQLSNPVKMLVRIYYIICLIATVISFSALIFSFLVYCFQGENA